MPCSTGKKIYATEQMAEDGLIETWVRFKVGAGSGPIAVYKCDDCGYYHLTSRGPMNSKLSEQIKNGKIQKQTDISLWEDKFK
ncbi:hypothetical protein [Pseudochryseolinea flava]|uniref:Uncharacterized protein n=1 Tax=Pseudochryseolinea flava TaxID=2059302 RepID=A0A364Y2T6_9BACT|nr:hypothetical protein [Pseudochryseolinea flava]RAW00290.1 hypothetical protein DQQ10_14640 [Pseudochryseolinea flava]